MQVSTDAFGASKEKVRRAQRHLSELRKEIGSFLRDKPFRSVIRAAGKGQQSLVFGGAVAFGDVRSGPKEGGHINIGSGAKFGIAQHGFTPFTFNNDPRLHIGQEFPTKFFLVFSPLPGSIRGTEVIAALEGLVQLVQSIIQSFESNCVPKSAPYCNVLAGIEIEHHQRERRRCLVAIIRS